MPEYHRLAAYIDLDAIGHNIRQIRKRIEPKTKLLAVVKADGYGHGATEVSKICLYNGVDALGVATFDEGVTLRENSIPVPILIFGNTVDDRLETVINYKLTQTVFSFKLAKKLSDTAVKLGKTALIHIKIDTGMGRIGFKADRENLNVIDSIFSLPNVQVTGIFTHFATADEADKTFTRQQYKKFRFVTDALDEMGHSGLIKHCANSGAILDCPDMQMDMVRSGIITYGMFPSTQTNTDIDLKPAMTWKSQVSFVKELDAGVSVGYGRTYYTNRETVVATVPVGYADGYSRHFSNRGRVLINGRFAPVIGNVCMDQMMVDVTDIPDVREGSEAVIMGRQGSSVITAEELAQLDGTINYEIVCNVGKRVPRVFVKNGEVIGVR